MLGKLECRLSSQAPRARALGSGKTRGRACRCVEVYNFTRRARATLRRARGRAKATQAGQAVSSFVRGPAQRGLLSRTCAGPPAVYVQGAQADTHRWPAPGGVLQWPQVQTQPCLGGLRTKTRRQHARTARVARSQQQRRARARGAERGQRAVARRLPHQARPDRQASLSLGSGVPAPPRRGLLHGSRARAPAPRACACVTHGGGTGRAF